MTQYSEYESAWNHLREAAGSIADLRAMYEHAQEKRQRFARFNGGKAWNTVLPGPPEHVKLESQRRQRDIWNLRCLVAQAMLDYLFRTSNGWPPPTYEGLTKGQRQKNEANRTLNRIAQSVLQVKKERGTVGDLTFTELMAEVDDQRPDTSKGGQASRTYANKHVEEDYGTDPAWWLQWARDRVS